MLIQSREGLKPARHKAKMTQDELAALAGTSRKVISDIERGVGNPSMNTWEAIVRVVAQRIVANDIADAMRNGGKENG